MNQREKVPWYRSIFNRSTDTMQCNGGLFYDAWLVEVVGISYSHPWIKFQVSVCPMMKCNAHKSTSSLTEYSPTHLSNVCSAPVFSQMTPNLRQNETAASAFIPSPAVPIRGCENSLRSSCDCSRSAMYCCYISPPAAYLWGYPSIHHLSF